MICWRRVEEMEKLTVSLETWRLDSLDGPPSPSVALSGRFSEAETALRPLPSVSLDVSSER